MSGLLLFISRNDDRFDESYFQFSHVIYTTMQQYCRLTCRSRAETNFPLNKAVTVVDYDCFIGYMLNALSVNTTLTQIFLMRAYNSNWCIELWKVQKSGTRVSVASSRLCKFELALAVIILLRFTTRLIYGWMLSLQSYLCQRSRYCVSSTRFSKPQKLFLSMNTLI